LQDISTQVLFEDNHIIAINKLPSQIVQGDKTGDTPLSELVKNYLKEKYQKPGNVFAGVIHRIDRPVSGVVLFARTSKALARMNEYRKHTGPL
jgi:23S rRNA pseudouridine1911/1915/1917 synthase